MQAFAERLRRLGDVTDRAGQGLLVIAAVAILVLKVGLLASININWDEFIFLTRVHEFHRGELTSAFQTFHVHFFQWLVGVPGNEVDQMIAARHAMFALRVAVTVLVFFLGLRVAGASGGLVAAIASLTFSHLIRHGESFRADSLIAFLFALCATLLVWRINRVWAVLIAAVSFAIAAAITIKTAIYAPALAGIITLVCWSADPDSRRLRVRRAILFALVAVATYLAISLVHATVTSAPEAEVARRAIASGTGMLGSPQLDVLGRTLRTDWPFWALFLIGLGLAFNDIVRGDRHGRERPLLLAALLLPLASLFIYRNTFEYFYVTIVPLASVACGYGAARIAGVIRHPVRWIVPVLLVAPMVFRGWNFARSLRFDRIAPQRAVIAAVHEMFPEPVPYLDRCGMISSFPRAKIFMSTYVLEAYRREGVPRVAEMVVEGQPRFLLANVSGLAIDRSWDTVSTYRRRLLREDFEFLQNNFVRHWGPIWVPGKRVRLGGGGDTIVTTVVAGPYTIEGDGAVEIDGVPSRPNDVMELAAGPHRIRGTGVVTLRYGARLARPARRPPFRRLFRRL